MHLTTHLAKHLRDVYTGGNWASVNFKDTLAGVTWQQATTQVYGLNTIATLVFHTNYYIDAVIKVFEGGPLDAKDLHSFDHPPINAQEDWDRMVSKSLTDAEIFAALVAQLPEDKLWEPFTDEKYGNYYRNIQGIIEHTHYHLGQIVVIKKILAAQQQ